MHPAIALHTLDTSMARAWDAAFARTPGVSIVEGDILEGSADALLSPANSFGYMDGGIDLAYRRFLGREIEAKLQQSIATEHFGELPVGSALVLETHHEAFPYLVAAPTMRVPEHIQDSVNVYLAFRAALIAVLAHNARDAKPIRLLRAPALGTGVGRMPLTRAALQMRSAYDSVLGTAQWRSDPHAILVHHADMKNS
jgi:O-acetyl-ADP-ribose deacetylase (regulator of RNase III)